MKKNLTISLATLLSLSGCFGGGGGHSNPVDTSLGDMLMETPSQVQATPTSTNTSSNMTVYPVVPTLTEQEKSNLKITSIKDVRNLEIVRSDGKVFSFLVDEKGKIDKFHHNDNDVSYDRSGDTNVFGEDRNTGSQTESRIYVFDLGNGKSTNLTYSDFGGLRSFFLGTDNSTGQNSVSLKYKGVIVGDSTKMIDPVSIEKYTTFTGKAVGSVHESNTYHDHLSLSGTATLKVTPEAETTVLNVDFPDQWYSIEARKENGTDTIRLFGLQAIPNKYFVPSTEMNNITSPEFIVRYYGDKNVATEVVGAVSGTVAGVDFSTSFGATKDK